MHPLLRGTQATPWLTLLCFSLILLSGTSASWSQTPPVAPPSTIEAEGTATADAQPAYVDFRFQKSAVGATMSEAMKTARAFPDLLTEQLETHDLKPSDTRGSDFSIANVSEPLVRTSVSTRFSLNEVATAEDGPEQFATLCDTLRTVAETLQCEVNGPVFGLSAPEALIDGAVANAVAQAFPAADAAARAMRSSILTVEHVNVVSVVWNKDIEADEPQPQIRRLTCTARVRVRYVLTAG